MAEQVKVGYQRLFEIRVLHHHYLYKGIPDFLGITNLGDHDKKLISGYDVRRLLSFTCTPATEHRLKGLGCVVKNTSLGFIVAAPDISTLLNAQVFEFYMTVQHSDFIKHTTLASTKRRIIEIQQGDKSYRYKENAFLLTNGSGTKHFAGGKDRFCLSNEIPNFNANDTYPADALTTTGTDLQQYVRDSSGALVWQPFVIITTNPTTVNPVLKANLPVFVHQGDSPVQTPPVGAPFRGIQLEDGMPNDVYALIRIETLAPNNEFSLLDSTNSSLDPVLRKPVFEIHFLPAPQL